MTPTDYWEPLPDHPLEDWQLEVANGDTRLGYWQWVEYRQEADQLAAETLEDNNADA